MFDDDHAVAGAGLALVGVLSEKLGLEELAGELVDVNPFPGRRVATLVHAMVAGAECIDDADVLRSGATSPGRIPPLAWGAIGFVLGLLGLIAYVALFGTSKNPHPFARHA